MTAVIAGPHRRRRASRRLHARVSAIEFKHQNISAAMLDLGLPYIRGYKPRSNYQAALIAELRRSLETDPQLLGALRSAEDGGPQTDSQLQRMPAAPKTVSTATSNRRGAPRGLRPPARRKQAPRGARRDTRGRL
jgi:hypothetical protein